MYSSKNGGRLEGMVRGLNGLENGLRTFKGIGRPWRNRLSQ